MLSSESPDTGLQHVRDAAKPLRIAGLSLHNLHQQLAGLRRRTRGADCGPTRYRLSRSANNGSRRRAHNIGAGTAAGR